MKTLRFMATIFMAIALPFAGHGEEISPDGPAEQLIHFNDDVDYAIPADSPVKFAAKGDYDNISFAGKFLLTGVYHYGYDGFDNNPGEMERDTGALSLYFVPDEKIASALPYWHQRQHVREVFFQNESDFITAVIPKSAQEDLKAKRTNSVSGHVSVWVDNYRASIECDTPSYAVRFISIDKAGDLLSSQLAVDEHPC